MSDALRTGPETGAARERPTGGHRLPVLLVAFLFGLILPPEIIVFVGPVKLPAYRIILILTTIPALLEILKDRENRVTIIDVMYFGYVFWALTSLLVVHGLEIWQYAGLTVVEGSAPYLLAKAYIRTEDDFRRVCRVLYFALMLILPFALIELLTGNHLLRDIVRAALGQGALVGKEQRLGLDRAFGPFAHPIHYGIFAASLLGLSLCLRTTTRDSVRHYVTIALAVFCSLSSGPLLNFMVQLWLFVWNFVTRTIRHRWRILAGLVIAAYVTVDAISNRTPFHVFITYMTLNQDTAYNRIHIWNWGTLNVSKHPVFGLGLNDWERAWFMTPSMDNFWLLTAMRHGLPALIFLVLAFVLMFYRVAMADMTDSQDQCRKGWAFTMIAFIVGGASVHYWDALYCYMMFLFGCGLWMTNPGKGQEPGAPDDSDPAEPAERHVLDGRARPPKRFVLD